MKNLIGVIEARRLLARDEVAVGDELRELVTGFAAEEIGKGLVSIKEAGGGSFHFTVPILGVDLLFLSGVVGTVVVWVRSGDTRTYGGRLVKDMVRGSWSVFHDRVSPLDADTFDRMVADLVRTASRG